MGTLNNIVLVNQFGEESINEISSVSSAGAVKVLTATTAASVTGKALTGLAAGTDEAITATDTILTALAKLQAQIDALP